MAGLLSRPSMNTALERITIIWNQLVIPAQAGTRYARVRAQRVITPRRHAALGSRFRGNDKFGWIVIQFKRSALQKERVM